MNRPYFALTGPELIEAIISEFRRKAAESGMFPLNKTFPQVSWHWECEVELYPAEPPTFKVMTAEEMRADVEEDIRKGLISLGPPRRGKIKGGRKDVGKTVPPDQVRSEEGMRMSKPVLKPGVGVVDELVDAIQPGGQKE